MRKMNESKFASMYRVRQVAKCCGTCKYFIWNWRTNFCTHPHLDKSTSINESCVCDVWSDRQIMKGAK